MKPADPAVANAVFELFLISSPERKADGRHRQFAQVAAVCTHAPFTGAARCAGRDIVGLKQRNGLAGLRQFVGETRTIDTAPDDHDFSAVACVVIFIESFSDMWS
nr:hypothetical protein [Mesorhizobium loti]